MTDMARRFDRANLGLRALRVHLYLAIMGLLGTGLVPLLAAIAPVLPEPGWLQGDLTGRDYTRVSWPGVVALSAAVLLLGQGLCQAAATGARLGLFRMGLGVFLVLWVLLAPFLFYPGSWGLVPATDAWPLRFHVVWWGCFGIYLGGLAVSFYGIWGLADTEVRAWLRAAGHGPSVRTSLARLLLGPRPAGRLRLRALLLAVPGAFLLGWGFYILYGIPLGTMAILSVAEARVVLGHRILEMQALAWVVKLGAAWVLILGGRELLRGGRRLSRPSVRDIGSAPIAALYLRPFRFDGLEFRDLNRGIGPRLFELDTGAHAIETLLLDRFAGVGQVLAIAAPDQPYTPEGSPRLRLGPEADWRATVRDLMQAAGSIVIVADASEGVLWELECIDRLGLWPKTLVLLPGAGTERSWDPEFAGDLVARLGLAPEDAPATAQLIAVRRGAEGATGLTTNRVTRGAYQAALAGIAGSPPDGYQTRATPIPA